VRVARLPIAFTICPTLAQINRSIARFRVVRAPKPQYRVGVIIMRVSCSGGDAFKALVIVCVGSLRKSPKNKANTIWPTHKPITKLQAINPQVPMYAPESTQALYSPPAAGLCLTVGQITVLQSALWRFGRRSPYI
jgi:hypothetical protein